MKKKPFVKEPLSKIRSTGFSRGLSLLQLTLSSGGSFMGLKVGDLFADPETRQKRLEAFLGKQAAQLVEEIGQLKGSIMKAGQLLSMYGEHFLPKEVNEILRNLHANSRPVVWEEMHRVLVQQLGAEKLDALEIERTPIGAASLGQVYRATVKSTGEVLALKVQYPGVDRAIDSDLKALQRILSFSQLLPNHEGFDSLFQEIRMILRYEVDYERELVTMEMYREWLSGDTRFVIPKPYREFSSGRVLAMSYESGLEVENPVVSELSQERRNQLGMAAMDLMFREIFVWKTVQTDPHFGNYRIRLQENGRDQWVLLDFGAVRKFPTRYIGPFSRLVRGALFEDVKAMISAGIELGFLREEDPEEALGLFCEMCLQAVEGFEPGVESASLDGSGDPGPKAYAWGKTDVLQRLTKLAKDAVFTFRLRPPPREALFLDRKMVGTYTLLTKLGFTFGPRKLIVSYVS